MLPRKQSDRETAEMRDHSDVVGAGERPHHDRYVHYTHEMSEETAEATARVLTRAVPLAYGAVLGGLIGNLALGVLGGLLLTVALDMKMGDRSMFRPLLAPVLARVCPVAAMIVRRLADGIGQTGLPVPAVLRDMRCGVPSA